MILRPFLANGTSALKNTYVLKLRLALLPTHKGQTTLNDMHAWATTAWFSLLYDAEPAVCANHSRQQRPLPATNYCLPDVIYVPCDERIAEMTQAQVEKCAFICDRLFGLKDLALKLLTQAVPEKVEDYLAHAKSSTSSAKVLLNEVIANNKPLLPRPHGLNSKLVISLTSYPQRFDTLANTLRCLLNQTVTPDHIVSFG